MIRKQTIEDFLNDLASNKPTPGGGSVAAVTAATAAALVEMVANLTKEGKLKDLVGKAEELRIKLLRLADEDAASFDAVMAAYKSKSKPEIKKALLGAIKVPEETKKLSQAVEKLAEIAVARGNKNAVSDASTAIHLAQAAQKSAVENIRINNEFLKKL